MITSVELYICFCKHPQEQYNKWYLFFCYRFNDVMVFPSLCSAHKKISQINSGKTSQKPEQSTSPTQRPQSFRYPQKHGHFSHLSTSGCFHRFKSVSGEIWLNKPYSPVGGAYLSSSWTPEDARCQQKDAPSSQTVWDLRRRPEGWN